MSDSNSPLGAAPDPTSDPEGYLASILPRNWDWKLPDYSAVLLARAKRLNFLRSDPGLLQAALAYYADDHFIEFITDWGMMRDPRLAAMGKSTVIPFIPFPKQIELLDWIHKLVLAPGQGKEGRGNVDKTRDCGFSYCCVDYANYRWRFKANEDIGFGSNLERNVYDDKNPKALFTKIIENVEGWPQEIQPKGWDRKKWVSKGSSAGKMVNLENGSTITGDCGKEIGRGGRTLIYFLDEHAALEYPLAAEGALSQNTNTQINGSTQAGPGTVFLRQCMSLRSQTPDRLFEFDWHDDPRKDQVWYDRKKNDPMTDAVIFAREVDRNPYEAVVDTFIPIDTFRKSRQSTEARGAGSWQLGIDIARMGNDKSVICSRRGFLMRPLTKVVKKKGDQLAGMVEEICWDLLEGGMGPLGAIVYELEGPGYEFHAYMQTSPFKRLLRPIHPQARLSDGKHFNLRALMWGTFKTWMEQGGRIPEDKAIWDMGAAIRYEWRESKGQRLLLIEDKKAFKSRMAADPKNKSAGPSPDEADACGLSTLPVQLDHVTSDDLPVRGMAVDQLDDYFMGQSGFGQLDQVAGY